ncbi:MAG TPA: methyltransferase, partial [Epsilonproteobacteria bacterium]|nr:methyltransferase [Campylobacterota bacterium]
MKRFTHETMWEILSYLEIIVSKAKPHEIISFQIPNPDKRADPDNSKRENAQQTPCLYYGWKVWFDLTELLQCRMMTPRSIDKESIILRYQKLDPADSFHQAEVKDKKEKYGIHSLFSTIRKNEEPAFLSHYVRTLKQAKIEKCRTVLDLGINRGDEFDLIRTIVDENIYR